MRIVEIQCEPLNVISLLPESNWLHNPKFDRLLQTLKTKNDSGLC